METTKLLRNLYLQILDSPADNAFGSIIKKKCVQHQKVVLTFFRRVLNETRRKDLKTEVSKIKAVIIKPVNDACNLACDYCYQGIGESRNNGNKMTRSKLDDITKELLGSQRRDLQFLWHGGEPLLAGIEFYRNALTLQKKYNKYNCVIWNGIQTNGLLLDKDWVDFIIENKFGLSLSFDGLENIHNKHRFTHDGDGTFSQLVEKFQYLNSRNVDYNVITVISDEIIPYAAEYWKLLKSLKIKRIDIHPACNLGLENSSYLAPEKYSFFMNQIFDFWLEDANNDIAISMFEEFFRALTGNPVNTCYHAGICSDIIAIEGNGNVIPCTRPFNKIEHKFGSLKTDNINGVITSLKYKDFREKDLKSQSKARNCKWYGICHNGCPQHRIKNEVQDIESGSIYCSCTSGFKGGNCEIWEHIYGRLKRLFQPREKTLVQ